MPEIDQMSGSEFEDFLALLFERLGYKVEKVGGVGDFGADLIIEKDSVRTAVQAKRWKSKVDIIAVQQVVASKVHYNATKAILVTNSHITHEALQLAKENNVEIIDRKSLEDLVLNSQAESSVKSNKK
jgi:restriction system protein